jgi:hypothetical protein
MSDEMITFLVLGATVAVFVWDRLPVALVAVGVALSLWATGVLELDQESARAERTRTATPTTYDRAHAGVVDRPGP